MASTINSVSVSAFPNGKDKASRDMKFSVSIPGTIKELVAKYGEDTIASMAQDALVIAFQGAARSRMAKTGEKRMTDADIVKEMSAWKPGQRNTDPAKKLERVKLGLASLDDATLRGMGLSDANIKNIRDAAAKAKKAETKK